MSSTVYETKNKSKNFFAKFQKKDGKLTSQDQVCEDQKNVEDFKTFIMVKKRKKDKSPRKN